MQHWSYIQKKVWLAVRRDITCILMRLLLRSCSTDASHWIPLVVVSTWFVLAEFSSWQFPAFGVLVLTECFWFHSDLRYPQALNISLSYWITWVSERFQMSSIAEAFFLNSLWFLSSHMFHDNIAGEAIHMRLNDLHLSGGYQDCIRCPTEQGVI